MFELSIAFKYLIPRKKQLSVALIALLSVGVISCVVWLVLLFLSVTEGIERGWLQKLTSLNAPLRITPTQHYYTSYFYQIDGAASRSHYAHKNIGEKKTVSWSDPYDLEEDGELPLHFPPPDLDGSGNLRDPVKGLFSSLHALKEKRKDLAFQDFEMSGALMRLQLLRPNPGPRTEETQGYLTQVSYLASFPDQCPTLNSLLLPPSEKDLNHMIYLASHATDLSRQDSPALALKAPKEAVERRLSELLRHATIQQVKTRYSFWQLPFALLPEKKPLTGFALHHNGKLNRIDLPLQAALTTPLKEQVKVWREGGELLVEDYMGKQERISSSTPLLIEGPIQLEVDKTGMNSSSLYFSVHTELQGVPLKGLVGGEALEISRAEFLKEGTPPWVSSSKPLPVNEEKETGVLLAKSFCETGVMIGDRGYLSYSSTTSSSIQEHRLPIFVAGFYDPGILSVGNKCILVPPFVTRTINASSSSFNLDKTQSNGVLVWFNELKEAQAIKEEISSSLAAKGLDQYWKVTTFQEYDFAKDLLQQFQSDKYLFTLVGAIILLVACCNIISLLVLLVNDKKKEIGILQAMGGSRTSIAAIFGTCGMAMGIISCILGTFAAVLTLHHIDGIVHFLSWVQGHDAFQTAFFGKSLPNQLSHNALVFVLIITPLLSLLAGLIPAIQACRLRPSTILRG